MNLLDEILDRFKRPWTSSFVAYLIIVMMSGFIGVFFTIKEVYDNDQNDSYKVAEGLATFFISVIATSFIDLNISPKLRNRKSIMMWSFILYGLAVFLMWWTYECKSYLAFIPAILGTLFSVTSWVVANADNENVIEERFFDEMRGKEQGHGNEW